MKFFPIFLVFIISICGLLVDSPTFASGPSGPPAEIILDKDYYHPGDEVNLEIHFIEEWGSSVELSVIEGPHTGNRIFTTINPITDFSQPLKIKFTLPEDSEFYQYLIVATMTGQGNYDNLATKYIPGVLFFTKQDADKVSLSDFFIEFGNIKDDVLPGQTIPIKFKIIDGAGNAIPNAITHVGICDESLDEPPSWVAVLPGHRYGIKNSQSYSGCIFLQRNIPSFNDEYDFKMEIPNDAPSGKYKLNIWYELAYPYGATLAKTFDINILEEPINPDEPAILVATDKEIDYGEIPEFLQDDEFLTYGQSITFYTYQMANVSGDIRGNPQNIPERYKDDCCIGTLPAIPDVNVHIFVTDPDRKIVFSENTNGGSEGNFEYLKFNLTNDLKPGIYEIYYNITKNGNYIQNRGANNPDHFYLVNNTKFTTNAEGKSFDVYFQSVDVKATNMEFDQGSKSLTFDLEKINGKFYNHYFFPGLQTGQGISCPVIYIEQPLLHGYFNMTFNGKEIGTCNSGYGKTSVVVGPISEDGKLEIVGTYVIPEFSTFAVAVLIISIFPIILIRNSILIKN